MGNPVDIARNDVVAVLCNDRFKHLDRQTARRKAKAVKLPGQTLWQMRIAQLTRRQVHRHRRHDHPGLIPVAKRGQRLHKHRLTQKIHQVGPLQRGQKGARQKAATVRMVPPHKRLHPRNPAAVGAKLGLEMRPYLAAFDRPGKG